MNEEQMTALCLDDLEACFTVGNARTAQAAGVTFARKLAGARSVDFAVALAEQEMLVERAIVEAGYGIDLAQCAAGHFGVAARDEWERILGVSGHGAQGTA